MRWLWAVVAGVLIGISAVAIGSANAQPVPRRRLAHPARLDRRRTGQHGHGCDRRPRRDGPDHYATARPAPLTPLSER